MKFVFRSTTRFFWLAAVFASSMRVAACSPEGPASRPGAEPDAQPDPSRATAPDAPPARWIALIGEYGPDDDVWLILEDEERLHLNAGGTRDPLEEVSSDEFLRVRVGVEQQERLVFTRASEDPGGGPVVGIRAAGVLRPKREIGTTAGETFRIDPVRDVEELRIEALTASPPEEDGAFRESDLVDLASLDSAIRFDVRYATTNNFMNAVFYEDARAFLQRPAAEAVSRASRALAPHGYGLLIHDGYRPWYVTKMFWDATPPFQREFVANPQSGSRHNRGAAVDLSLYDLETGEPIEMPSSYDEFSHRSYADYTGGTARQRWHRDLLREVMEAEGFTVNPGEWWHFDHQDWREYGIQNEVFDEIGTGR